MINNKPVLRPETLTVGYGYDPNDHMRAAKPPIYLTSTFTYPDAETALRAHDAYAAGNVAAENGGFVYARLDHPNLVMLQDRLAALDHAAACAVFNSGMSALATIMLTCLRPGDALLHTTPIYGGTHALMNTLLLPVQDIQPFPLPPTASESDLIATATAAMKHGPVGIILAETPPIPPVPLRIWQVWSDWPTQSNCVRDDAPLWWWTILFSVHCSRIRLNMAQI